MSERYIYNMNHEARGRAVIINNTFYRSTKYCMRKESSNDVKVIEHTLMKLGFKTVSHEDLSGSAIEEKMKKYGQKDFTNSDCFVCVIMSYGEEGVIYGNDGCAVELSKLMKPFMGDVCNSLAGKPKLFFVQACTPRSQNAADFIDEPSKESNQETEKVRIPVEADFLTVFSCLPGEKGWDSESELSWFIEALSDVLKHHNLEYSKLDLLSSMTNVNNKIYKKILEKGEIENKDIDLPSVTSMLTRLVYFPAPRELKKVDIPICPYKTKCEMCYPELFDFGQ